MRALAAFGAPLDGIKAGDFAALGAVLQVGVEPVRIDILTQLTGLTFDEAWRERIHGNFGGIAVALLSREHIIRNKEAAGRPQDHADLARLRKQ